MIPWRGGDAHREHHFEVVCEHLTKILPGVHLTLVDDGSTPFSRAGSRNRGVRLSEEAAADVVVLCDADTLVEPGPLHDAIHNAHEDGLLHLPYTWYRGLSPRGTTDYLDGAFVEECQVDLQHEWATGGILTIRPDAWWRAGGMDERFRGYGHEDVAFRVATDTLLGPTVRHNGTIIHLWHPPSMGLGSPQHVANSELCDRYNQANGNPAGIRELIAERAVSAHVV